MAEESPRNEGAQVVQVPAERRTIVVQGLTPALNEEFVGLYFEKEKYGGGEIESITLDNQGGGRVVFKELEGQLIM